jgi:hypothetical protein
MCISNLTQVAIIKVFLYQFILCCYVYFKLDTGCNNKGISVPIYLALRKTFKLQKYYTHRISANRYCTSLAVFGKYLQTECYKLTIKIDKPI